MPRNRPGQVRARQRPRTPLTRRPVIAGLSSAALAEVARVEHSRNHLWAGVTADALAMWGAFVRRPYHRLWTPHEDGACGIWECCGNPYEAREFLESVILGMYRRRARELRAVVDRLDTLY
ncbi:hypothetical protein ACFYYR_26290 [Streptomyces sp. NPDC001922]|uniref:hypothetical protein n=1 Tax=Streptomyces sp. NPDC001922 TaxID=3364624 RepID=UPI0036CF763A